MKTARIFTILLIIAAILCACSGNKATDTAAPSGSGSVDANGNVTLDFWYSLSGDAGEAIESLVKEFNDLQAGITVTATYQGDYSAMMAKIYSALAGDALPNVAQVGGAPLLGTSGAILAMDDFVNGENGLDISTIRPAFVDYNSVDGVLWSLPFNNSLPVMYYNRDMFTAAGLDPDKPPETFAELVSAAEKMTLDPDQTGSPTQYGFNTRDDTHWYLSTMFLENGAAIVSDDMSEALYNSPQAVEMLTLWSDMVNQYKIMPPNQHSEAQTDFLAGKLAIFFGSSASINSIVSGVSFDLGVAVLPQVGENSRKLPVGGGSLVIFKNDNQTIKDASWAFVKFMMSKDSSIFLSTQTGYLPVYTDAFNWPEIQALVSEQPARKAAIDSLDYSVAIPVFSALGNSDLALRQAIEKVELKAATPQDALDEAVVSVNRAIQQYSNP